MLFETLKQGYIFLGVLYFGLITGIIRDLCLFISKLLKNNKIVIIIIDLMFSFIFSLIFILCINIVNYGEFRIYLLLSYIFGYIVERKTLGYLVDFIFGKIYNLLIKVIIKLSKSKIIKRILNNDRKTSKNSNKAN